MRETYFDFFFCLADVYTLDFVLEKSCFSVKGKYIWLVI